AQTPALTTRKAGAPATVGRRVVRKPSVSEGSGDLARALRLGPLVLLGLELLGGGDRGVHVEAEVARLLDEHDGLHGAVVVEPLLVAARGDLTALRPVV